jgi:predicted anti-sigma-YlaC factor YlaD
LGPGQNGISLSADSVGGDEVTCQQFVALITDYFEGALAPRSLSQVEEHLVMCDWCVTYSEQMRATIDALSTLQEAQPAVPSEAVLAALRAKRKAGR